MILKWIIPLTVLSCTAPSSPPASVSQDATRSVAFRPNPVVEQIVTAQALLNRMGKESPVAFVPATQPVERDRSVMVFPDKTFQQFLGIGGAITDASAEVFAALPANRQEELLTAYYSKEQGIGYHVLRTNIHSCDFSSGSYTYVKDGDSALHSFSIDPDRRHRLPMIKRAWAMAGGNLMFYVSPWSPPAFMKSNGSMLQGGSLLPEYANAWANYYVKFIRAYEAEGLPVWGLTIQNEPMAVQTWESCIYTAEQERDFLKNHLGPALEKAGMGDKKVIVWDHNRDLLAHRAHTILGDPDAARFVWGIGFHWYETWAKGQPMWDNLMEVQQAYPDKQLIFTEGCNEKFDATQYQRWSNAERYGKSMIQDFNRGTAAWTDWNILLDQHGGPNHVGNFCFAPIHADTRTGELIYTPSYAYIGHFSKYIQPGAVRVATSCSHSTLMATTFQNPNGRMVTVVMNEGEVPLQFNLVVGNVQAPIAMEAHSIRTLLY